MSDASKIEGLTKREYFAAAALPAIIAAVYAGTIARLDGRPMTEAAVVEQALAIADALIAASKSSEPGHE